MTLAGLLSHRILFFRFLNAFIGTKTAFWVRHRPTVFLKNYSKKSATCSSTKIVENSWIQHRNFRYRICNDSYFLYCEIVFFKLQQLYEFQMVRFCQNFRHAYDLWFINVNILKKSMKVYLFLCPRLVMVYSIPYTP